MPFVYAILIGGAICGITQAFSEIKLPFPVTAIIMMTLGGVLTATGTMDVLNAIASGGVGVTAVGFGNGAYSGGQVLALAGVPAPLIICILLSVILVAMGAACGGTLLKKFPGAFMSPKDKAK